jgi:hypothetical protein
MHQICFIKAKVTQTCSHGEQVLLAERDAR